MMPHVEQSENLLLGVPDFSNAHIGVDKIGNGCRIHPSVSVMRYGRRMNVIEFDDDVSIYENTRLVVGDVDADSNVGIKIGARTIVNAGAYLSGEGGLVVGSNVLIGPHVKILSAGHEIDGGDNVIARNGITRNAIKIGDGSWIGAGAILLEGVEIGHGAVVAAGALVRSSVSPGTIVAGIPAVTIRKRVGFSTFGELHDKHDAISTENQNSSFIAAVKKWLKSIKH